MYKPPCLILDKRYYPFLIVNYKKSFLMSLRDDINVLVYHPTEHLHTVHYSYPLPVVIQIDEVIDEKIVYVHPSRRLIFIRDDYICQYCGKPVSERNATVDHVIPKSQGGPWSWTNLVTCCEKCNQAKGNQIWQPLNKPKRPEPFIIMLQKHLKQLDLTTFDIWRNWLPIKLRKFAEKIYSGNKDGCYV